MVSVEVVDEGCTHDQMVSVEHFNHHPVCRDSH